MAAMHAAAMLAEKRMFCTHARLYVSFHPLSHSRTQGPQQEHVASERWRGVGCAAAQQEHAGDS